MADIVSPKVRSRMMAGIRGKDTAPELTLRSGLHRLGFRFRLHDRNLPGRPDLVFPARRAAIFVHGCFWHGHSCPLFKWPSSRVDFWRNKIEGNRARDETAMVHLKAKGWRALTVWECALKGKNRLPVGQVIERAAAWLTSGRHNLVIRGRNHGSSR